MLPDGQPTGDDAKDAAHERLLALQREALAEMEIASADDLDHALDVLGDAALAQVLAAHPLAPESEAALPDRVQELLRKARRGINYGENKRGPFKRAGRWRTDR
jgi:hypothetical protein